ncbi:MAG TPA: nuclear transport factor 2 family protein [Leifsonia sp.]|nr:nuclear transport factor 2 family protein [Leifsonia sp.]
MPDKRISESGPPLVVERLLRATNDHDLAALVSCFAADYVNNTPAHPDRSFTGRAQVHANWQRLFAGIPDLRAELLDKTVDGETVWTEWRMHGTRPDGAAHELVGAILFTVRGDEISRAAFYLEPVERDSGTVDDQIARVANGATS